MVLACRFIFGDLVIAGAFRPVWFEVFRCRAVS
jgi:hypothetical protein